MPERPPTFNLGTSSIELKPAGEGDDPLVHLKGQMRINSILYHVEAVAVERRGDLQEPADPAYRKTFDALVDLTGTDGGFATMYCTPEQEHEYALFIYPYDG